MTWFNKREFQGLKTRRNYFLRLCVICVCALKRLKGIYSLCVCMHPWPPSVRSRCSWKRKCRLSRESVAAQLRARRARYLLRAATFSQVCTVLLFKQQEAFHGTSSRKPMRINPTHDGLPTPNRMHIKCKCRALHSRSAVSGIRSDSQIIFNAGARKKHFTTPFSLFCSPFCRS